MQSAWDRSCTAAGIPSAVADKWFDLLSVAYRPSVARSYHNIRMLERKFELLEQIDAGAAITEALVLAVCFQYYTYDVRHECGEQNVLSVREFFVDAHVENVSLWQQ